MTNENRGVLFVVGTPIGNLKDITILKPFTGKSKLSLL